jgi:hypothetical protein
MANRIVLEIDLTEEKQMQIKELARHRGYDAPGDYLLALVEIDAKAHEEMLDTEDDIITRFKRSLQDALAGETHPVSTLWDGIDDE